MTTPTVREHFNGAWLATLLCCVGVVITGLSLEDSVHSLSIATVLCFGLLSYGSLVRGSQVKTIRLIFFNSALLFLIFVTLRVGLGKSSRHFASFSPWAHRIYRVWWLSECSAIILALIAVGLLAIGVAGYIGGNVTRRRFQWGVIAAASVLCFANIANLLRAVSCVDCFFPYGVPFTFFTEGGYAGGGGFVWYGLVGDAALILTFAALCALLWNRIAR